MKLQCNAVSCFLSRSFSRSRSLVNHCFDGQAPWKTIYISKSKPQLFAGGLGDGWRLGTGGALPIDACNVGHGRTAKSSFFHGKCCHEITQLRTSGCEMTSSWPVPAQILLVYPRIVFPIN